MMPEKSSITVVELLAVRDSALPPRLICPLFSHSCDGSSFRAVASSSSFLQPRRRRTTATPPLFSEFSSLSFFSLLSSLFLAFSLLSLKDWNLEFSVLNFEGLLLLLINF
ncbi:uncharacterized protein DS421_14g474350 [Arachis hypogaea]|nr:uncharacterized protein DS421_14g474350 [Arachis hypogaea]